MKGDSLQIYGDCNGKGVLIIKIGYGRLLWVLIFIIKVLLKGLLCFLIELPTHETKLTYAFWLT